jgi:hypothetical protein
MASPCAGPQMRLFTELSRLMRVFRGWRGLGLYEIGNWELCSSIAWVWTGRWGIGYLYIVWTALFSDKLCGGLMVIVSFIETRHDNLFDRESVERWFSSQAIYYLPQYRRIDVRFQSRKNEPVIGRSGSIEIAIGIWLITTITFLLTWKCKNTICVMLLEFWGFDVDSNFIALHLWSSSTTTLIW